MKAIDPDDIPLPYRSLLVHQTDMTLTLERHFGGRVALRPLATFRTARGISGACCWRRSTPAGRSRWGRYASECRRFPERIRQQILKNDVPLGRLLRDGGVEYESRPKMFLVGDAQSRR